MNSICLHPNELSNLYSSATNCKECGTFLTKEGVESL